MLIKWHLMSRLGSETQASEVAEAALVLPLVFMLFLGIFWFGRAFNTYATINHAAQEVARMGVAQTCASCGNSHMQTSDATNLLNSLLQASSVDPSKIIEYAPPASDCDPPFPTPHQVSQIGNNGNVEYFNYVRLTPSDSAYPSVCGVRVTFQYPYQFWLPFTSLNKQQIILTADVQMKGEY